MLLGRSEARFIFLDAYPAGGGRFMRSTTEPYSLPSRACNLVPLTFFGRRIATKSLPEFAAFRATAPAPFPRPRATIARVLGVATMLVQAVGSALCPLRNYGGKLG